MVIEIKYLSMESIILVNIRYRCFVYSVSCHKSLFCTYIFTTIYISYESELRISPYFYIPWMFFWKRIIVTPFW